MLTARRPYYFYRHRSRTRSTESPMAQVTSLGAPWANKCLAVSLIRSILTKSRPGTWPAWNSTYVNVAIRG